MLIPIGTDLPLKRQPTVTYFIIALNILILALKWSIDRVGDIESSHAVVQHTAILLQQSALSVSPFESIRALNLLTHLFIHADWLHVLGNMIFLLAFGRVVEDRLGHLSFAFLYLCCGALAGYVQIKISGNSTIFASVIGASGAVAAITAAYVVLAPASKIKVLFIFFIISVLHIPSLLFVSFYVLLNIFDVIGVQAGSKFSNIGHVAHLVGYASGFTLTICLLLMKVATRSQYDLLYLIKQSYRRKKYRRIVSELPATHTNATENEDPVSLLVASITQIAATGDPLAAAERYLEALESEPTLQLNRKTQLLLGSSLIQSGRIEDGVQVYEMYLKKHLKADDLADVALLLIAKYTRDLKNVQRAKELLKDFSSEFSDAHKPLVATLTKELEH